MKHPRTRMNLTSSKVQKRRTANSPTITKNNNFQENLLTGSHDQYCYTGSRSSFPTQVVQHAPPEEETLPRNLRIHLKRTVSSSDLCQYKNIARLCEKVQLETVRKTAEVLPLVCRVLAAQTSLLAQNELDINGSCSGSIVIRHLS